MKGKRRGVDDVNALHRADEDLNESQLHRKGLHQGTEDPKASPP
ncbi:hypothetical protein [Bacillus sinesaloumensis]|nr:hypothetical protein [Bacillus sinesaloumensis]